MPYKQLSSLLSIFLLFIAHTSFSQHYDWERDYSFTFSGPSRYDAVSFVIGDTAYIGAGRYESTYLNDFYKYNPNENSWIRIENFPGVARAGAVAFTANGKGYVGTGTDGTNMLNDFYEYDPSTGSWTQVSDFAGSARKSAVAFSVENIGYVGTGLDDSDETEDFYKYDPTTDEWTEIAGLGSLNIRQSSVGFAIDGKGYIVSGTEAGVGGTTTFSDVRSYDPDSDSWNEEIFADVLLSNKTASAAFVLNGKAYIVGGSSTKSTISYDPSTNELSEEATFGDDSEDERTSLVAFSIDTVGYAGFGYTSPEIFVTDPQKDLWSFVEIEKPSTPFLSLHTGREKTSFEIRWGYNGPAIDGYYVYLSTDSENYDFIASTESSKYIFDGLTEGTRYYYRVSAYRATLESDFLEEDFLTKQDLPFTPDSLAIAPNRYQVGFELTWDDNSETQDGYIIQRSEEYNGDYVTIDTVQTSGLYYYVDADTSLAENFTYFYKVMAYNEFGNSEPSSVVEGNTNDLVPEAPELILEEIQYSSETFSPRIRLEYTSGKRVETYQKFVAKDDGNFEADSPSSNFSSSVYYLTELSKYRIKYVVSNRFGSDTTNTLEVFVGLDNPYKATIDLASEKMIEVSFTRGSYQNESTIIERSVNEGEYSFYTDYNADDYFMKNNGPNYIVFYDSAVNTGDSYRYRIKNQLDTLSSNYAYTRQVYASNKGLWKEVSKGSAKEVIDSLGSTTFRRFFFSDGLVYLLSLEDGKFMSYDVSEGTFENLSSFSGFSENERHATGLNDNKIYVFGGRDENYDPIYDTWVYDIDSDEWSSLTPIPTEYGEVNTEELHFVGSQIYFSLRQSPGFGVGKYDPNTSVYEIYNKPGSFYAIGSYSTGDSIVFVSNSQTYNEEEDIWERDSSITFNYSTQEFGTTPTPENLSKVDFNHELTSHKGENHWVYSWGKQFWTYDNLKDFNHSPQGTLEIYSDSYKTAHDENVGGIAFSHNDTLYYGFGRFERSSKSFQYLYYLDEVSPLPPSHFRADNVTINSAVLKWVSRETNLDGFILYEYDNSNGYVPMDTLSTDQRQYELKNLDQDQYYSFQLRSYRSDAVSVPEPVSFKTIQAIPNNVENLLLVERSSSSVTISWEVNTEVAVDQIRIINPNLDIDRILEVDDTSYLVTGLDEGLDFWLTVYAENEHGSSGGRNIHLETMLGTPVLNRIIAENGTYTLNWSDNSENETHYKVERKDNHENEFTEIASLEGNTSEYLDIPEDSGETYTYRVSAVKLGYVDNPDSLEVTNYSEYSNEFSTSDSRPPLGLDDLSNRVYPNPTNGIINLIGDEQALSLKIFGVNGQLIRTTTGLSEIDLSSLPNGIYMLEVEFKGHTEKHKVIKN